MFVTRSWGLIQTRYVVKNVKNPVWRGNNKVCMYVCNVIIFTILYKEVLED